ncbi:hypothetical protein Slu03_27250 [Sediminihabitans luteus]|uniref:hypothetical protein n=1 Tax=Sediminihabitans luteus TaxID=1138585 RepID=UPI001A57081D|nr:hypothetical protein [Sediminihabitans luteus]GIJ00348.1 hypothetical protein Slu03_27250 [Sediminihabitans luteus]
MGVEMRADPVHPRLRRADDDGRSVSAAGTSPAAGSDDGAWAAPGTDDPGTDDPDGDDPDGDDPDGEDPENEALDGDAGGASVVKSCPQFSQNSARARAGAPHVGHAPFATVAPSTSVDPIPPGRAAEVLVAPVRAGAAPSGVPGEACVPAATSTAPHVSQ